eukprot:403355187
MRKYSQSSTTSSQQSYGSTQQRNTGSYGQQQGYNDFGNFGGFGGFSGFNQQNQQNPFGSFYEQQAKQKQRAEEMRRKRQKSYEEQYEQYNQQQQQKANSTQRGGYTYYKDKNGREYYEFKGSPQEFYEQFFKQQQDKFKDAQHQYQQNYKGYEFDDFFKQGNRDAKPNQDPHYKSPFEQWQEEQMRHDPLNQAILLRSVLRALFFFFGFMFMWKILFGLRQRKEDAMSQYYMQQMYHDPAMYAKMAQGPQVYQNGGQNFAQYDPYVVPNKGAQDQRRGGYM